MISLRMLVKVLGIHYMQMMGLYGKEEQISDVINNIQNAIIKIERWTYDWGFKMSVDKSYYMLFARKRKLGNIQLKLHG